MSAPELVLFDLDHTLLDGDSDVEWLSFLIDEGAVDRSTEEQANADMARRYQEGAAGTLEFVRFYLDAQQKRGRTPFLIRVYCSRAASIQFPRNWPISQFRAVHFPSPLGRGGRGEGSGDLLDRREEILQDAARAEVDLGADRHAGASRKRRRDSRSCPLLRCSYNPGQLRPLRNFSN